MMTMCIHHIVTTITRDCHLGSVTYAESRMPPRMSGIQMSQSQARDEVEQRRYTAYVARDAGSRYAALALRHHVFVDEMGAVLHTPYPGLDWDEVDAYCDHLVVRDNRTGNIVATTRLLSSEAAAQLGRFYSEHEFQLGDVLGQQGRFLEVGRTCVDTSQRGGLALPLLWKSIADYAATGQYDYLMGCASIQPGPAGFNIEGLYRQLVAEQLGPEHLGVRPLREVPSELRSDFGDVSIPPLLKGYLRLGAWICGEPCWDPDFNVMDVFILLPVDRLKQRYVRHFFESPPQGRSMAPVAQPVPSIPGGIELAVLNTESHALTLN